ncbi:MAG: anti-sigma factor [Candidatus Rokubacteria bacterium]|nr:anti-sigma factor [Candidatus Rokubacteria bacterium]
MNHDLFDTQAAAYAVGALDGDELRQFEEHLATGCAACRATLVDCQEALARAAMGATPVIPPPDVKAALLRRPTEPPARAWREPGGPRRSTTRWGALTAAAMVASAFFTGLLVAGRYEARLGTLARETAALRDQLRREEIALRDEVARYQAVIDLLRDPETRVVALRGAGPAPQAVARLVWHPTAGGQLLVSNLPPAPDGKAYELWTITGTTPRPAGVFQVDARGTASVRVEPAPPPAVDVFAVTLEPAPGVPKPTGPIVLASSR